MKESVIVHAQYENGKEIDVNISYDALFVVWNPEKGTLTLKLRESTEAK